MSLGVVVVRSLLGLRAVPWIAASLVVLAAAGVANAQPSEAETAAAEAEYQAGLELMEQALYAEALARFQASFDLMEGHPNQALILFQIGRAHQAIGSRCLSIAAYERFLDTGRQDYREDAERRLANVRAEARASGLECDGGGGISPVGPLVMVGGGLVGLAGLITGILVLNAEGRLDSTCDADRVCPPSEQGLVDEHGTLVVATDVLLVSAATLVSAGLILTLLLREGGSNDDAVALGGACGPDGCGVVVRGRF